MEIAMMTLLSALLAAPANGDVPYGIGQWPERGFGNHRAVVHVSAPSEAVLCRIVWRRRDRNPEAKDVRVYDAATGARVTDVLRVRIERHAGEIVFRPQTAPGDYYVYYLPYNPGQGNFDDPGTYFPPSDTADPAWVARFASPEARASLPRAEVRRIEARGEFHRMDPMEVVASEEEVAALLAAHPDSRVLFFCEDRTRCIRMPDDLPLDWVRKGPSSIFAGDARPNEWYAFQIGVWAARADVRSLSLEFEDLKGPDGPSIPASRITCINLEGSDWVGREMRPVFQIGKGAVRPLWILVDIPRDARGAYTGAIGVRVTTGPGPGDVTTHRIGVLLNVSGSPLEDHGVGDLWRMSRLMWLNSKLGLDDHPVPPFTPLKVKGNVIGCLGRSVRFGATGLPAQVTVGKRGILARPTEVTVHTAEGTLAPRVVAMRTERQNAAVLDRVFQAELGERAGMTTRLRMEFDGCLSYDVTLQARSDLALQDVALRIPVRRDVARYLMGFGIRGGYRPPEVRWKWNVDRADNQVWIGDPAGGIQLTLKPARDAWDVVTLRDAGLPDSWHNGGQGGCTVTEEGGPDGAVLINAYSGPRTLRAGQEVTFRFRLLITPFKPLDRRHWDWRYGSPAQGGTVAHIHHGVPENPYINYPFIEVERLRAAIQHAHKQVVRAETPRKRYDLAGKLNLHAGAIHVWVKLRFDPTAGVRGDPSYNQELLSVDMPNEDQLALYWNVDVRGLRAYVRNGPPARNTYPAMVDAPLPEWRNGQEHLLTLSWGERLAIYVDGKLCAEGGYAGLRGMAPEGARLVVHGAGFDIQALKVMSAPYRGGGVDRTRDASTLLLERAVALEAPKVKQIGQGVNLYYTVRELSNHVAEMWALRSLGDEIFQTRETFIYSVEKTMFGQAGGGYPWLQEHLVSGYVPAWRQPLPNDDHDAAIGTQGLSRWHNYYVEGLRWLMENLGLDGLYLDGIGYDREIMKRVARVMSRANPNYRINFHSGDNYAFMNWCTSPANTYMEHFPYISNLWFGEFYDYELPPDVWLVEISGIPFGLTSEMLNYENGGNPYRGMIYGMTGRFHPSASAMWRYWDRFGIQTAEWLGYWSPKCPVRTDRPDVLATVYRKKGKSLIALAHWPQAGDASETIPTTLQIDWKALGLDPKRVRMHAPAIEAFQEEAEFEVGAPIPVPRAKGWLIEVSAR